MLVPRKLPVMLHRNVTSTVWRRISAWGVLLPVAFLAACSAELIRKDADEQLRKGAYEKALETYEQGLSRHPDSVPLRAGQLSARARVLAELLAQAGEHRSRGDEDEAVSTLRRATRLYPSDERPRALLQKLEGDQRRRKALREARSMAAKGLKERALLLVEAALKEEPGAAELLELRGQLEHDAHVASGAGLRLAESRPVSLDFKDVSLRLVLDLVTRSSGINFVIDKDVKNDLQTSVLLRHASVQDILDLLTSTNQLTYKVLDSVTVLIYPKTPEKVKEYQDLLIRAFYLSSADVKQTAVLLKSMLKIRDPFVDEKLNLIVIREPADTVRLAERLIALQDVPEPEVLMEVQVLEIKKSHLTELGVNYPDGLSLTPLPPSGSNGFTLGGLKALTRNNVGIAIPGMQVNFHRDVDAVHILANPKIRARNREKARVLIGDKLPVITTTGTATNNGFFSESVQYVDVGLKLDVEPDIYLDDEVAIKVGLEVSSLVREIKTSAGSIVYQIGTRAANTVLRLRDGETQLLAGLMSNEERSSANRIPGLGDLPVLGRLFSSQRDNAQRTEVVLSLTPHIVRNIRRPAPPLAEFWSGTENEARSRPLTAAAPATPAAARTDAPAVPSAATAPAPGGEGGAAAYDVALALVAPADAKPGAVFSVHVDVRSVADLRGMPIELAFTPSTLEFVDATPGEFLAQGNATVDTSTDLEQRNGRAMLTLLRTVASGAKGEGRVATLRFKATAPGVAELRLVSAKPISLDTVTQAPMPSATLVTVR